MATSTWFKSPLLPSWLSAVGTIAIAFVAFFTLGPVIENLKLREINKKLEDELIDVQDQIHQAKQTLEIKKTEADSVKKALDIDQKVLNSLNDQNARLDSQNARLDSKNARLDSANEKLIENLEVREEERIELKKQLQQLNQEATSLQSENATFKARNNKLLNQMASIRNQLDKLSSQLAETKKAQRSYVVESIILKAKAMLPQRRKTLLDVKDPSSYFSWGYGLLSYQDGREIMKGLYNSREFDLLAEIEGRKLKQKITNFMDKHQKVFSEPLIIDLEVSERYTQHILATYIKSKKKLSPEEVKKIKEEYKREMARAEEVTNRLTIALDEMLKELV